MSIFRIKSWFNGAIRFEGEFGSMKLCVEAAVKAGVDLYEADLSHEDLDRASLDGARLVGARLDGASLTPFRDDLWAVLSSAPAEVPALLEALKAGKVDGSTYTGECACLVGTIAKARGCDYRQLGVLKPDSGRPAEAWFAMIKKGDTPEKHDAARIAAEWIEEWLKSIRSAFGGKAAKVKV